MIKPRIKKLEKTEMWVCYGGKHTNYASSPKEAYDFWYRSSYGECPVEFRMKRTWWKF